MPSYSVYEPVDLNDGGIPPHLNSTLSGRYGIQTLLGVGRTSRVYEARVFPSGEKVAVKVLREHCNTSENLDRLKWEGDVLSSLDSEYFLRPIDYVGAERDAYLVTEKANGHTLAKVLRDFGRLSLLDSLDVSIQIAEALMCLHNLGYVHGNLTTEDIMVERCNNRYAVKIVDLDSTSSLDSSAPQPGAMFGESTRFEYMSPEQAMNGNVDLRTDVYIFGLLFYEMLTGRRPFFGASPIDLLNARFASTPEKITEVLGGIEYGDAIDQIIDFTLAPQKNQRFENLHEIHDVLCTLWTRLIGKDYVSPRNMTYAGAYDQIELSAPARSNWLQKIAGLFSRK